MVNVDSIQDTVITIEINDLTGKNRKKNAQHQLTFSEGYAYLVASCIDRMTLKMVNFDAVMNDPFQYSIEVNVDVDVSISNNFNN